MISLRWITFLLGYQTVTLTVLPFWIDLFLQMLVFVLLWLSLNWEILIMLWPQFPLTFCQIYNGIPSFIIPDWDSLHDHLTDVSWKDISKLSAFAGIREFCKWVQVGIDVYLSHHKYQINPGSSPWFSSAWTAAIVHRNHVFCLHQQNKSSVSKVKFRQASNCCKIGS